MTADPPADVPIIIAAGAPEMPAGAVGGVINGSKHPE